jgi:hypothetical protein
MSKTAVKAAGKGDKLQQKSPAEFFAENKNIAGFDNVSAYSQHLFCCLQQPRLVVGPLAQHRQLQFVSHNSSTPLECTDTTLQEQYV